MKGLIQEYGLILVGVAAMLICLLFGKQVFQHDIKDATVSNIAKLMQNNNAETGENITKPEIHAKASDIIEIEGTKYIVLEERKNNQALVMTVDSIGNRKFQSNYDNNTYLRTDGQNANTYEGSDIDKYLENTWYKGLSAKIQKAIQAANIKQASYARNEDPDSKQETGYNGQVYNTISRHVFLPSVSEIGKIVDLKNPDKVSEFLGNTRNVNIWTRDSYQGNAYYAESLAEYNGRLSCNYVDFDYNTRPVFVIDLSKVDYTKVGHVDYK